MCFQRAAGARDVLCEKMSRALGQVLVWVSQGHFLKSIHPSILSHSGVDMFPFHVIPACAVHKRAQPPSNVSMQCKRITSRTYYVHIKVGETLNCWLSLIVMANIQCRAKYYTCDCTIILSYLFFSYSKILVIKNIHTVDPYIWLSIYSMTAWHYKNR